MAASSAIRKSATPTPEQADIRAFVSDGPTRDVIARALRDANLPVTGITEGGITAALKHAEPGAFPRVLIVDISDAKTAVADVAALAAVIEPGTKLVVLGATNDVALFRDLLGVGASDYLVKPLDPQLLHSALVDQSPAAKSGHAAVKNGKILAVIGSRGGVGATTLAVNTAWLFAHVHKCKTALVDLDLHFGTASLALDLEPGRGLREALEKPGRIDSLFIERAMVKVGDRLYVLSCEEALRERPFIDPNALEVLLGELRQNFDWVVVDLPRAVLLTQAHALTTASDIVLATEQSLAGIRDTTRILDVIKEAAAHAPVKLAATSADGSGRPKVGRADFEKSVGRKLDYDIPFDPKATAAAANSGKPLSAVARGSRLVKTMQRLSGDLIGNEVTKKKTKAKATNGLLRWIWR